MDLYQGTKGGTSIVGYAGTWNFTNANQQWILENRSVGYDHIGRLITNTGFTSACRHNLKSLDQPYFVLSTGIMKLIWQRSGLSKGNLVWMKELFDCDDFAFAFKTEVAKWAANNIRAVPPGPGTRSGFAVLCGIMTGINPSNSVGHCYNFTLSDDFSSILFFEPQTGGITGNIGYYADMALY